MKKQSIIIKTAAALTAFSLIFCLTGCNKEPKTNDVSSYVPTTPSQEYINTLSINSKFLPQFYAGRFAKNEIDLYEKTVDAFTTFQTTVPVTANDDLAALSVLLGERFPQFYGDTKDAMFTYTQDKSGICWQFNDGATETSHHNMLVAFEGSVKGLLNGILEKNSDAEKAIIIFKNLSERFTPDYEAITSTLDNQDFYKNSAYSCLVGYTGTYSALSKGYAYLLNLAGIEAYQVYDNKFIDNKPAYTYVLAKIDGNYYFIDTTTCLEEKTLKYFGLTSAEMESRGYKFSDAYLGTEGKYKVKDYFVLANGKFAPLRSGAKDYSLDLDGDLLYFLNEKGEKQQMSLKAN
ncbi:MAG: hypothetical protein KBS41_02055 [Oscillospiraceae bacterium]|nr:hypothetical protein [Candidatus Equicaccousia limihippi]